VFSRLLPIAYVVIGMFVAAGVLGDGRNYFSELDNLEEIAELVIAVFLWPLVVFDVNIDIGGPGGDGGGPGDGGKENGGKK
jgi:hypothetical protein